LKQILKRHSGGAAEKQRVDLPTLADRNIGFATDNVRMMDKFHLPASPFTPQQAAALKAVITYYEAALESALLRQDEKSEIDTAATRDK
jgi:hypothetical protein